MYIKDRILLGLNVIIKKKPYIAGLCSSLTGKDCSTENTFDLSQNREILPFVSTCLPEIKQNLDNNLYYSFLELLSEKTKGRTMFLICGASSSGKDTLASLVKENLYHMNNYTEYTYCKKYTTRDRRANEGIDEYSKRLEPSGNYIYCKTLEEMRSYDIDFEYILYECHYALDVEYLISGDESKKHLSCIYGKLENIADVKQKMFEKYNRIPFSILIKSPVESLKYRINGRHSMSKSEKSDRITEMERQTQFIESQGSSFEANFDLVINNGNDKRLSKNAHSMTDFVHNSIEWANKSLQRTGRSEAALTR